MPDNGKLPWFPFHVDRFHASRKVQRMSAEQVGIYLLLLLEEWDRGPLSTKGVDLEAVCHGASIPEIRRVLRLCFRKTEGGWVNDVMEEIRTDQVERHRKRVEAGKKPKKTNE